MPPDATRSSMACTTCRQVKLRCDANKRYPQPCTRCERLGKVCVSDPSFKRRVVRGALEKALEEKEQLQRLVQSYEKVADQPEQQRQQQQQQQQQHSSPLGQVEIDTSQVYQPKTMQSSLPDSFSLWETTLRRYTVIELLEHFSTYHLPHIPILDIHKPIDAIYEDSRLLFWTVIYIACRYHPTQFLSSTALHSPFKRLLSEHLVESVKSIYTIQSLLILSLWPFPVRYQSDDSSWNFCCLAVSATLQMGLDDTKVPSRHGLDSGLEEEKGQRLKTWLSCFIISTSLSAVFALPQPMTCVTGLEDLVMQRVVSDLSPDFRAHLEITKYSVRAAAVLSHVKAGSMRQSLIEVLERDLDSVEQRLPDSLPCTVRIELMAARLRLYALYLFPHAACPPRSSGVGTGDLDSLARAARYKGFEVAIALSGLFARSVLQAQDTSTIVEAGQDSTAHADPGPLVFYPKSYFRILVMAAIYLLKLLALEQTMATADKMVAHDQVKQISTCLRHWSSEDLDEFARAARMLEELAWYVEDKSLADQLRTAEGKEMVQGDLVADGIKTLGDIRRLYGPDFTSSSQSTPPQSLEEMAAPPMLFVEASEMQPVSESSWQLPWDEVSPQWNAWPTDINEILQVLGTEGTHMSCGME